MTGSEGGPQEEEREKKKRRKKPHSGGQGWCGSLVPSKVCGVGLVTTSTLAGTLPLSAYKDLVVQ